MRGNPDDLANQDLAEKKIHIKVLKVHANNLIKDLEEIYEALVGADGMERYDHAELIEYIHQLKTIEEEQGTVYTGDAPSTEASFYKKGEVEDLDNQSYSEGEEYDNE